MGETWLDSSLACDCSSAKLSNGQNTTNKFLNRGVFDYGGGLDYRLFRFFGLRGEVRDSVSSNPNLNVALSSSNASGLADCSDKRACGH